MPSYDFRLRRRGGGRNLGRGGSDSGYTGVPGPDFGLDDGLMSVEDGSMASQLHLTRAHPEHVRYPDQVVIDGPVESIMLDEMDEVGTVAYEQPAPIINQPHPPHHHQPPQTGITMEEALNRHIQSQDQDQGASITHHPSTPRSTTQPTYLGQATPPGLNNQTLHDLGLIQFQEDSEEPEPPDEPGPEEGSPFPPPDEPDTDLQRQLNMCGVRRFEPQSAGFEWTLNGEEGEVLEDQAANASGAPDRLSWNMEEGRLVLHVWFDVRIKDRTEDPNKWFTCEVTTTAHPVYTFIRNRRTDRDGKRFVRWGFHNRLSQVNKFSHLRIDAEGKMVRGHSIRRRSEEWLGPEVKTITYHRFPCKNGRVDIYHEVTAQENSRIWDRDEKKFVATAHNTVYTCEVECLNGTRRHEPLPIRGKVRGYFPDLPHAARGINTEIEEE